MTTKVKVTAIYQSTLTQAFKTPLLCDVSKIHTGFGLMPKVTHSTDHENWGKVGASKKIFTAKSLTQKGGFTSTDKILERIENEYWKFEVSDFQSWMLGFTKFTGEWRTIELSKNQILIEYTYTLHAKKILLYPLNWLFAETFWRIYMKRILRIVEQLIKDMEPYQFE